MSVRGWAGVAFTAVIVGCGSPLEPTGENVAWAAITMGDGHGCVLDAEGRAGCFGSNARGQLGVRRGSHASDPVWVSTDLRWSMLDGGAFHTCGVVTFGEVWCWGANESGQLGLPDRSDRDSPARVDLPGGPWVDVAAGFAHSCAVRADGLAMCWGWNQDGQLGIGRAAAGPFAPTGLDGRWSDVEAGRDHTCAIATSGRSSCWGGNRWGQLGTGVASATTTPSVLAGEVAFESLALGDDFSCGTSRAGGAWCWGGDRAGFPVPGAGPGEGTPIRVSSAVGRLQSGPAAWCRVVQNGIECRTADGEGGTIAAGDVRVVEVSRENVCFIDSGERLDCVSLQGLRLE